MSSREVDYWGLINARYKRRPTLHVPKLMEMSRSTFKTGVADETLKYKPNLKPQVFFRTAKSEKRRSTGTPSSQLGYVTEIL